MAKIIVVTSGKGGVGKTTTSAAFGTGLAIASGTVVALMFIMDRGFVDFEAITAF